jgi:hypothetical protein
MGVVIQSRCFIAACLAGLLVTGVGSCTESADRPGPGRAEIGPTAGPARKGPPKWTPKTRSEELAVQLADGRRPTLQEAIDVFDTTVTAMPGATATGLPRDAGLGVGYAFDLLREYQGALSPAQRRVLDGFRPRRATRSRPGADVTPSPAVSDRYHRLFVQVQDDWRRHRPDLAFPARYALGFGTKDTDTSAVMSTQTLPTAPDLCSITVYPLALSKPRTDDFIRAYFAHEIFHCVQYQWRRGFGLGTVPAWVREGGADWAMLDLYRGAVPPTEYRTGWFEVTEAPLEARTYGAWPLYQIMRQEGIDPYDAMRRMNRAGDQGDVERILAAGIDGAAGPVTALLQAWPARTVRPTANAGAKWQFTWPTGDERGGPRNNATTWEPVGPGENHWLEGSKDYSQFAHLVPFAGDVGVVTLLARSGHVLSVSQRGPVVVPAGSAQRFCLEPGGCRCPDGTQLDAPPAVSPLPIAFQAASAAGEARLTTKRWDPDADCDHPSRAPSPSLDNGRFGRCPSAADVSRVAGASFVYDGPVIGRGAGVPKTTTTCGYTSPALQASIAIWYDPRSTTKTPAPPQAKRVAFPGATAAWLETRQGEAGHEQGIWILLGNAFLGVNFGSVAPPPRRDTAVVVARLALGMR